VHSLSEELKSRGRRVGFLRMLEPELVPLPVETRSTPAFMVLPTPARRGGSASEDDAHVERERQRYAAEAARDVLDALTG